MYMIYIYSFSICLQKLQDSEDWGYTGSRAIIKAKYFVIWLKKSHKPIISPESILKMLAIKYFSLNCTFITYQLWDFKQIT